MGWGHEVTRTQADGRQARCVRTTETAEEIFVNQSLIAFSSQSSSLRAWRLEALKIQKFKKVFPGGSSDRVNQTAPQQCGCSVPIVTTQETITARKQLSLTSNRADC